jgi:DNA-binding transcriptional regulator YdaS (Cro superfamily)
LRAWRYAGAQKQGIIDGLDRQGKLVAMPRKVCYSVAMEDALREAVKRVGGLAALARQLDISPQAVQQWRIAPAVRTLEIERLTGVSRYELRPDLYPREWGNQAEKPNKTTA